MGSNNSSTHDASETWNSDPRHQKLAETLRRQDTDVQNCARELFNRHTDDEKKLKSEILSLKKQLKMHQQNLSSDGSAVLQECLDQQQVLEGENKRLRDEIERLKSENHVLYTDKENALSRLSKIAGIQLTKGNSDITDLSDANRPTLLAEKWSCLYTDEWSEAYDDLTMKRTIKNDNFKVEKEIYGIATECYRICKTTAKEQMTEIKRHAWDIASCLHQQPDQLVEARQTTMYYKMNKEDGERKGATVAHPQNQGLDRVDTKIRAIQKCMDELLQIVHERRKYDEKLRDHIIQVALQRFDKYKKPTSSGGVIKFVKRCTELCWSMVIKEPIMFLLYDQLEGKTVDKNCFSLYTVKGSIIDFVIWPALLLHENGPLLSKGTVQVYQISDQAAGKSVKGIETANASAHHIPLENNLKSPTENEKIKKSLDTASLIVVNQSINENEIVDLPSGPRVANLDRFIKTEDIQQHLQSQLKGKPAAVENREKKSDDAITTPATTSDTFIVYKNTVTGDKHVSLSTNVNSEECKNLTVDTNDQPEGDKYVPPVSLSKCT